MVNKPSNGTPGVMKKILRHRASQLILASALAGWTIYYVNNNSDRIAEIMYQNELSQLITDSENNRKKVETDIKQEVATLIMQEWTNIATRTVYYAPLNSVDSIFKPYNNSTIHSHKNYQLSDGTSWNIIDVNIPLYIYNSNPDTDGQSITESRYKSDFALKRNRMDTISDADDWILYNVKDSIEKWEIAETNYKVLAVYNPQNTESPITYFNHTVRSGTEKLTHKVATNEIVNTVSNQTRAIIDDQK